MNTARSFGALYIVCSLAFSLSVHAQVVFSDATMANANWTEVEVLNIPGDFSFAVSQDSSMGYPSPSRRVTHAASGSHINNGPGGADVILGHYWLGASYVPASQGAIASVTIEMDVNVVDGGDSNAVAYALYLRQGNIDFFGPFISVNEFTGWQHVTQADIVETQLSDVSQTLHPDFSASGGTLQVGFVTENGSLWDNVPISSDSLVDNWNVTINNPDTRPPSLSCPPFVLLLDSKGGTPGEFAFFNVTANDDRDQAPLVVCMPPSGSFFPRGTTIVTCIATDASGNQATCMFPMVVQPSIRRR